MSIPSERAEVLIVGGGPSGLTAALLLARRGVRSIVVERNTATEEHPKAHELNARSIEILREIGISEADLAVEASPIEDASRILFCRTINEEFGRIDLLADPERRRKYELHLQQTLPYLNLSQSEFEKILHARAEAAPLIDLRFGHRFEGFEQGEGGVTSRIAADSAYTIESTYLLGCDGAASRVRKATGIAMDGPVAIQSFVNAYFKADLRAYVTVPAKLYWIMHPEYAGTFVAHHMARRWIYGVPVQTPWERPESFTAEVMLERIRGALGFDVPGLTITSLSTWHMTAQIAQRYRAGNVFLVGDAAHRFPPTGGLGMNTGIADAHNLCWKLAMVLSGDAGEALLDTYETERRPVAQRNCAESHANFDKIFEVVEALGFSRNGMAQLARAMHLPPVRWFSSRVRGAIRHVVTRPVYWFGGRALKDGAARKRVQAAIDHQIDHFDRLGLDIGYAYAAGAVIADPARPTAPGNATADYTPSTAPGARLPHAWVGCVDGRHSTLDHVSYDRFVLLAPRGTEGGLPDPEIAGLRVVDSSEFPKELFAADDLVLVRPDGHVAWRGGADAAQVARLPEVMRRILGQHQGADAVGVGERA